MRVEEATAFGERAEQGGAGSRGVREAISLDREQCRNITLSSADRFRPSDKRFDARVARGILRVIALHDREPATNERDRGQDRDDANQRPESVQASPLLRELAITKLAPGFDELQLL
jgi:hypothetical protein